MPIYGIAGVFVLYNLFFPMYKLIHLLLCAALAAICFVILKKVCPDKFVEVEIPEPKPTTGNAELDDAILQGRAYIAEIRQLNERIPDQALSEKLDEIEQLMREIFKQVEREPNTLPKIRKMMNYYLPTTMKLVRKYAELQDQNDLSSVRKILNDISDMLDTVITALRKQLDGLYEHNVVDITADIQVMEQMLAAQGLTEQKDFEI